MMRFSIVLSWRYASVRKFPEPHAGSPTFIEAILSCSFSNICPRFAFDRSPSARCSSFHSSSRNSGLRHFSMFSTLV